MYKHIHAVLTLHLEMLEMLRINKRDYVVISPYLQVVSEKVSKT